MTGKPGVLPKNASVEELSQGQNSHRENGISKLLPHSNSVNPPAILFNTGSLPKNKSFSNSTSQNTANSLNATKATLVKMIQDKGSNQQIQYMSE